MNNDFNQDYLMHYGVLGMKWGVRRYQNPDGSLTAKGLKRYSTMDANKLNKMLKKEVRAQRKDHGEYTGWSNKFLWDNAIGENSKTARDAHRQNVNKLHEERKAKEHDVDIRYSKGMISEKEGYKELDAINDRFLRDMKNIGAAKVYGEKYSKNAIKNIGKMNIGYLMDIGFNKETSEYINSILAKSDRVRIY